MAVFEKLFSWKEGKAKVWFSVDHAQQPAEAKDIRIEKSTGSLELPEFPVIVENANGERIFRSDRLNQDQGRTFEYFDNVFSKEVISFIDTKLNQEEDQKKRPE